MSNCKKICSVECSVFVQQSRHGHGELCLEHKCVLHCKFWKKKEVCLPQNNIQCIENSTIQNNYSTELVKVSDTDIKKCAMRINVSYTARSFFSF